MFDERGAEGAGLAAEAGSSPFMVARARVVSVERLTPSFMRIGFGGFALREMGTPGHNFDQRVKLIFPEPGCDPAPLEHAGADWYRMWLDLPGHTRGAMRSYTIRGVEVAGDGETRIDIDFVLHAGGGDAGPALRWVSGAEIGDEVLIVGPRRGRFDGGGIEYAPGEAASILLAGDETAAPAIGSILEDVDPGTRGTAFIEVPVSADCLRLDSPAGVDVRWLPRNGADRGSLLIPAVLEHLKAEVAVVDLVGAGTAGAEPVGVEDAGAETTEPLWETPTFSAGGEVLPECRPAGRGAASGEQWFWIAGESSIVTTLRRQIVRDLAVDRRSVAFMGYWKQGVAMRG